MASTYENDLRLEEMATGENSGSWGTKTNNNLELVADAFSYGTEIIADEDTPITIADGAADAARSLALKITSSEGLTTTRLITLGPNTVSKVWIIENSTSGGEALTISAGSGSNITLENGRTKIIATDGIGAGSNVVELTQDIAIADLFVDDDLTVGDDIIMNSDGGILKIGADADLQVTHSGSAGTITNATGDLTLDVAGDILLDADGADIKLLNGGTHWGSLYTNSTPNNLYLQNMVSDGDIYLSGSDGGSSINALVLDMSEAGAATFNAGVTLSGDLTVDTDTLYVDSTNDRVGINDATPSYTLDLKRTDASGSYAYFGASSDGAARGLIFTSSDNGIYLGAVHDIDASSSGGEIALSTGNSEAMRINSAQKVIIGATSTRGTYGLTVAEPSDGVRIFGIASGGMDAVHFDQARGSVDSPTASNADGDGSYLSFSSYDGTNFDDIGSLAVVTDGAQDAGRMIFRTTPTGSSQTERMRLNSNGHLAVGFKATIGGGQSTTSPDAVFTVQDSGASVGKITAVFGADENTNSYTDNTNKEARVGIPHYDTDEEPVGLFYASANSSSNNIIFGGGTSRLNAATAISFRTAANATTVTGTEVMRIDSSQRVLIGMATAQTTASITARMELGGTDSSTSSFTPMRFSDDGGGPSIRFSKSRSSTITGSRAIVSDDDVAGTINWAVDDGNDLNSQIAYIGAFVDGTPAENDTPGRLTFNTASSGNGYASERVIIDSSGNMMIANQDTDPYDNNSSSGGGIALRSTGAIYNAVYQGTPTVFNRMGNDGAIVQVRADGGNIGFIGRKDSVLFMSNSTTGGVRFGTSSGSTQMSPCDESGALEGSLHDLGSSSYKWRDVHASRTVDCAEITYDNFNDGSGNGGLNVVRTYSYDDDDANTLGSDFNNRHTILYVVTSNGVTAIPMYPNAGSGVAWQVRIFDPDDLVFRNNQVDWTQAGSNGNTFQLLINPGGGSATIERTGGSLAYTVYVSRQSGGTA